MNCAFSRKIISFVEKTLFTLNDLVSAAKYPKKEHHTVFEKFSVPWFILQKSKLFLLVADYSLRIHSYELRLLYKSGPFLRENYLYLEQSAIGRKKFQKVQPEPFLKTIQFHDSFYFRRIFYF